MKRSHNDTIYELDDADTSGMAARSVRRVIAPGNTMALRDAMLKRYREEMGSLNQNFQQVVASYQIPNRYDDPDNAPIHHLNDACEFLRQAEEIESRFGDKTGDVIAFGTDDSDQLGLPMRDDSEEKETIYAPFIVRSLQNRRVRMVAAGGVHSVVITLNGDVLTWGIDDDGTLGRELIGDEQEAAKTPGRVVGFVTIDGKNEDGQIVQVAVGDAHCLYRSINGNVYMHGVYRDLKDKKYSDIEGPDGSPLGFRKRPVHVFHIKNAVHIEAGLGFNAAILEDGSLVTWGFGNSGELARSQDMTSPDPNGNYDLGHKFCYLEGEEEEPRLSVIRDHLLTPKPVRWNFGGTKIVLSVACGSYHMLATAREVGESKSRLYSSGLNSYGQLGHGDGDTKGATNRHELTLVKALENENITQVAAGVFHSLALNLQGTILYAFGRSDYGQLGIGPQLDKNGKFANGTYESLPVPVVFPGNERPIIAKIAAGDRHSLAITHQNELYTWGFNETGATGHKSVDDKDVYYPKNLDLPRHLKFNAVVSQLSGGGQHTLLKGTLYK